jgi:cystathionine beta-synthase
MKYVNHVSELIGNTPLIKLNSVTEGIKATVLAKVEYFNPGGSIKDRIAKNMLEAAEQAGTLKLGMTVVEATSGNTGIGLAMACAAKGCVASSRSSALWLLCSSAADHRSVES